MMKCFYFKRLLLLILYVLFSGNTFSLSKDDQKIKPLVIVIDPGHGGKDPGAVNKGIREKDVVLAIGLKLGKLINESFPDVKVIFTRSTDIFVPLIDRSKIANKNKAKLFISLHANFCGSPSIRGTETFLLGPHRSEDNLEVAKKENSVILLEDNYATTYEGFDPNSSESYIMFELVQDAYLQQSLTFADDVQQQFKSLLASSNRGVKQAGFLVLRQSSMPSVLIETGFISNLAEANYLKSEEGQQVIASSVLKAFRIFKSKNSDSNSAISMEHKNNSDNRLAQSDMLPKVIEKDKIKEANASEKPENKLHEKQIEAEKQALATEKNESKVENSGAVQTSSNKSLAGSNSYYSVQIGASTTSVEPVAANFKGLKNVRRDKSDKYFRYYVGKEASLEKITPIWNQIKVKFPQAFIVSFVNDKRIIINSGSK